MKKDVYSKPLYYEIAFSFVNPKKQVNLFKKFIKRFSKIKVKSFLDIACGPALQLREIAKRGYKAIGLDLSSQMVNYLKKKAKEEKIKIDAIKGNMIKFKLRKKGVFDLPVERLIQGKYDVGSYAVHGKEEFNKYSKEEMIDLLQTVREKILTIK